MIKFTDILLTNTSGMYERLGIFRMTNETGMVKDIQHIQTEKQLLKHIIKENLRYVPTDKHDFGYTISETSKNNVNSTMTSILITYQNLIKELKLNDRVEAFISHHEKKILDIEVLYEWTKKCNEKINKIKSNGPKSFILQLINALIDLGVTIPVENLDLTLNNTLLGDEFFNIIKMVSDFDVSNLFSIQKEIKQQFSESQRWYKFLIRLNSKYITFKNYTDLINECSIRETEKKKISETKLNDFLNDIDKTSYYEDVENLVVISFKLKALKAVLSQTMKDTKFLCSTDDKSLVVAGTTVKISDVFKANCWEKAQFIEIFAFSRLFIDQDINKAGREAHLSIISPNWEIIGKRDIILNGKDCTDTFSKASDGFGISEDGKNGKPGKPGGPAGHFFGVGETFQNHEQLTIYAKGSRGGKGQSGGNGANGIKGESPVFIDKIYIDNIYEYLAKVGFDPNCTDYTTHKAFGGGGFDAPTVLTEFNLVCDIHGKDGHKPGNGGNGGIGGFGGEPGIISIINLQNKLTGNIRTFNTTGTLRESGEGGKPGSQTQNGNTIRVRYTRDSERVSWLSDRNFFRGELLSTIKSDMRNDIVRTGTDGGSTDNRDKPKTIASIREWAVINKYKKLMREYLSGSTVVSKIRKFTKDMEENKQIQSYYNLHGLIGEFQDLENQYFQLKNDISFIPFLESLLNRSKEYNNYAVQSDDDKVILSFLYAGLYSKIVGIKEKYGTILNLKEYLKLVKRDTETWEVIKQQEKVIHIRDSYKNMFNEKIKSSKNYTDSFIIPEIESLFNEIENSIRNLIEDVAKRQTNTEQEIQNGIEQRRKLEKALAVRQMLNILKIASACVSFLGPIGASVGAVGGSLTMVFESLYLNSEQEKPPAFNSAALKLWNKASDEHKNRFTMFKHMLEKHKKEWENELSSGAITQSTENIGLSQKVSETQEKITKILNQPSTSTSQKNNEQIEKIRKEFYQWVDDKKKEVSAKKEKSNDKKLAFLSKLQTSIILTEVFVDGINQENAAKAQLKVVSDSIENKIDELHALKTYENAIYALMIPMIQNMEKNVDGVVDNLSSKSNIELDVSKWQVQMKLRDVKMILNKMTRDFDINDNLQRSIAKLDDSIEVLINIYNRFNTYRDHVQFADYISKSIADERNDLVSDEELKKVIISLRATINMNILLQRYNDVIFAVKQHTFPFASIYLAKFDLAVNARVDNINSTMVILKNTINEIADEFQ